MTDDALMQHFTGVQARVRDLPERSAFAFGLGCLERTWPALARAAGEVSSPQWISVLREAVDRAWDWTAGRGPLPADLRDCAERVVPEAARDGPGATLFLMGNAFADFGRALVAGDSNHTGFAAMRPVDVLELLRDELGLDRDALDPLFTAEIERQNVDLYRLTRNMDGEGVRRDATNARLLEDLWFSS